jgi:hypothetical protein
MSSRDACPQPESPLSKCLDELGPCWLELRCCCQIVYMPLSPAEALRTCAEILGGVHDDLPTAAFYFAGGIDEIRGRAQQ